LGKERAEVDNPPNIIAGRYSFIPAGAGMATCYSSIHFWILDFVNSRERKSMNLSPTSENIPSFAPCVQCGRCSSGCPVAFESPDTPRKVLRFLQIGRAEEVSRSPFPWLCATCQACTVRCPRGVDVAGIMLSLRRKSYTEGKLKYRREFSFYRFFYEMVESKKRIKEIHLGIKIALRKFPLHPLEDAILLFKLWRRGKIG
jgi:heterodisulfide reductase subunit C2